MTNEDSLVPNLPNAGKLVYSLRHLDYNNLTALADLVDNTIDANATHVWVDIMSDKKREDSESDVSSIVISDNGVGMSKEILDEALKLGSEADKNASCDLGLYGMGLVTASISMGTYLEVITRDATGDTFRSVQDLDLVFSRNEFVKTLEPASAATIAQFDVCMLDRQKCLPVDEVPRRNTGTVVTINRIDNCQWKKVNGLAENLSSHFGQVYRKFIKAGKICIFVQGKEVKAIDPIYDHEPSILFEEDIKLDEGTIKVSIAELRDYGPSINKEKGINIPNQGFYVLRNNREIISGETLGIFPKHNDFNTLRIEFSYPGTLDTVLSSNFSKNKIVLGQSIKNKVETLCNPFIKQVRAKAKVRQQSNRGDKEDFSEVEKFITQKSHLLKLPQVEIEKREPRDEKTTEKIHKDIETHGPRLNIQKRKRVDLAALKARFAHRNLGEKGPLYEADQERETVVIYWNDEHPFYKEFIERNANNAEVLNPICFLVYCLGNAELIAKPDSDSEEILSNIRFDVGRNLAVLLK